MNCIKCKKLTTNPKFCSTSCAAKFNNKLYPKRTKTKVCKYCPTLIASSRTRCKLCHNKIEYKRSITGTIGDYRNSDTLKGKHRSWLHSHVRSLNRGWNKHLTKLPCAICNYSKHVELAHIKAVSSFPDEALVREVNASSNVIQLCPNCHWELDNGLVSLNALK